MDGDEDYGHLADLTHVTRASQDLRRKMVRMAERTEHMRCEKRWCHILQLVLDKTAGNEANAVDIVADPGNESREESQIVPIGIRFT